MDDNKFQKVRKSISGDGKSKRFLDAIESNYGQANTTTVRQHAMLNRNEVNYRFSKLHDLGLIEVEYEQNPHPRRNDIKIAKLTKFGEACLDRGLTGEIDAENVGTTVEQELRKRVSELEASMSAREEYISQLNARLERLTERMKELELGEMPKAYEDENQVQ